MNRRPKVLTVDDEDAILNMHKRILPDDKYEVITKRSGEEGLEYLKTDENIAVVISNNIMGGMHGLEFLQRVKAHSKYSYKVLSTSNLDDDLIDLNAEKKVFDMFVPKPVMFVNLVDVVDLGVREFEIKKHVDEG